MHDTRKSSRAAVAEAAEAKLGPLTFPSLIHDLCEERTTGVLTIRDGENEKSIFIDRGEIVFARSNDQDDRLGSLLLRRGMVPLHELESSARLTNETGKRLGGILVERQVIRPQDLVWGVREQVKEIVIGLFDWIRGVYQMETGALPSTEVITLKMPTADIVLEGVKRIESWKRIQLAVGSGDTRYKVTPRLEELGREMSLNLEEWTLLSRCEGPVLLRDLCKASPMKDFEVCRLVWAFAVVGLLSRID